MKKIIAALLSLLFLLLIPVEVSGKNIGDYETGNVKLEVKSAKVNVDLIDENYFGKYCIYKKERFFNRWVKIDESYFNNFTLNLEPDNYYEIKVTKPLIILNREQICCCFSFYTACESLELKANEIGSDYISLKWNSQINASEYKIYRKQNNGKFKLITSTKKASYTDKKLNENSVYEYSVKAISKYDNYIAESEFSNVLSVKTTISYDVPPNASSVKTYAYYTAVDVKSSPAFAVLNSGQYNGKKYETYTDNETGIRMVEDCYCAALATYYGTEKGTKYKITLDNGNTFKIILCDTKADIHTDKNNQYSKLNKDMIEFYVDKGKIPDFVDGNYNAVDKFKGKVIKIEKILQL